MCGTIAGLAVASGILLTGACMIAGVGPFDFDSNHPMLNIPRYIGGKYKTTINEKIPIY